MIRTILVTPTRLLVGPLQQESSNSVTRRYNDKLDGIIRVQFADEEDKLFVSLINAYNADAIGRQFHEAGRPSSSGSWRSSSYQTRPTARRDGRGTSLHTCSLLSVSTEVSHGTWERSTDKVEIMHYGSSIVK